jgi:hypothetical protein
MDHNYPHLRGAYLLVGVLMGYFPFVDEEELTRAAKAVLKGGHVKVFAKCDNCPEMGELLNSARGRPEGWIAADIEAPAGRVSLVLCPTCADGKLGPLLPKPLPPPEIHNAKQD